MIAGGVTGTSYVDNTVSGGTTYQYSVTAVGECETAKSNWVSVVATGECALAPCFDGASTVVNNETNPCGLTVQWNAGTSSCTAYPNLRYTVYKSTDPNFTPSPQNQIATCLTGTSYVDSDVAAGLTFYYIVRAEDSRTGQSGPCNGGNVETNLNKRSGSPTGPVTTYFSDTFESGLGNWTSSANWALSTAQSHSPTNSAWSGNVINQCDTLTQNNFVSLPSGAFPKLSFWTYYNIESGWDGGIVEGSANGTNWTKLAVSPNYPGTTNNSTSACIGTNQSCFNGSGTTWTKYTADLSTYAGGNFKVRYRFASDGSINNGGWYIDDVVIDSAATCQNGSPNCTSPPIFSGLKSAQSAGTSNCQINLSWDAAYSTCQTGPNVKYNIYRSTDPDFEPTAANLIASCITGTSYTDTNVYYGNVYYYIVRAEDSTSNGNGPCNNGNIDLNKVKKSAAPSGPDTVALNDDFESGLGNWTVSANWSSSTTQSHSPTHSAWSGNVINQCDRLTLTNFITPPAGSNPSLTFWTYYNIESGWDGGIVEASANGTTWTKLTVSPNYPGTTNTSTPACIGTSQACFSGTGTTWTQYSANLSAYAGGNMKIRFTYASDGSVNNGGWYIDDVVIKWGSSCTTTANAPGKVLNNLTVSKSGSNIVLNWQAPGGTCSVTGYGIYRGQLPWTQYNHASLDCSVSSTSYTDTTASNSHYYLVVPLNNTNEGTYGTDSGNNPRPVGSNPCKPQDTTNCN
jgi:fibronectin type 3 domain-containing protein